MSKPRTDAELVVELVEAKEHALKTIMEVREMVSEAILKYLTVGHPCDQKAMSLVLGDINSITEEYAE